jgi:hypothetical protein
MTEIKDIDFTTEVQFRAVELLYSSLSATSANTNNNAAFSFEIKTEIQLNQEQKFVIVIIAVKISNESKETQIGSLATSNIFYIDNYNTVVSKDAEGNAILPELFVTSLNAISLSTTRGVMWSTFKGTMLHDAILPIIDPKMVEIDAKKSSIA